MNNPNADTLDNIRAIMSVIGQQLDMNLGGLHQDINRLLQAQEISNCIAMANNMEVPPEVRQQCLQAAMARMGLRQTQGLGVSQNQSAANKAYEQLSEMTR